ncbi:hypothetical protein TR75_00380 [Hydrogenibacillus schlegelii]|uniref:Transposase n=1 Tax=Hydrogenibacillus schlegelii TaxID=1484 RepID=A0A132NF13_HYDSH|nr:hypothetical protein TR75_00380 [Hydrogenibacillus schlegelii]OAR04410.1 hypothetical protein SA87_02010 [Hydrogenibacillus schlegelii]
MDQKPVYLCLRPRRFRCPSCRKVFTETFPGIKPWARMTDRAMGMLFGHLRDRSFRRVAEETSKAPERFGAFCFGAFAFAEHRDAPCGS